MSGSFYITLHLRSLTEPGVHWFGKMAGQQSQRLLQSPELPQSWDYKRSPGLALTWGLGMDSEPRAHGTRTSLAELPPKLALVAQNCQSLADFRSLTRGHL